MPTKITETNKRKVTSHHIIKPGNLLEASVGLKYITIIQITANYSYSVLSKKGQQCMV